MSDRLKYLPRGATPARLVRAAEQNHTEWFRAKTVASDGDVLETHGVRWSVANRAATITFPNVSSEDTTAALDVITREVYARKLASASCWSLLPAAPRNLGARLVARGFHWGWQPHWMALDLAALPPASTLPSGLRIEIDSAFEHQAVDIPYYNENDSRWMRQLTQAHPCRMWHFLGWLDGKLVAHSAVYMTSGKLGCAGIYNVGVLPKARRQGIGKAISLAPCMFARDLGCSYALLNSAADFLYDRIGFQSVGHGQSWWIHGGTMAGPYPSAAEMRFAEAVGSGDLETLNQLTPAEIPGNPDAPLTGGMTPLELAVAAAKPGSARWLMKKGAVLGILEAWDLKWKGRAVQMLRAAPDLVNHRSGSWQTTPMHTAVERNDIELVKLLLTAKPDMSITDSQFQGTPLGWARHLERAEIVKLLTV